MKRISFLWLSPFLSKIGRKFGIDAHYFAKHSFYVLLGHGVSIVRGIIAGYFVARFFSKEVYGEYQFILSVVGMLTLFGLPGLSTPVARAWSRGEEFSLEKVKSFHLKFCLIGSAILLGSMPFLAYYDRTELWPLFLAAAVLFPLPPIAMVSFGSPTVGQSRFDLQLNASLIWSTLTILATIFIIFFYQSALLMFIVSVSIPPLVYLYMSRNMQPPEEKGDKNTRSIIRYGLKFTFATLPVDLVWYLDKLLISHFLGLSQLATFSVAFLIPEQVKIFVKQFLPVSFAKQAKGVDSWERRMKLMKVVLIGTLIFAVGILAYIAVSPWLMPFLFPQYDAKELVLLTSIAAIAIITSPGSLFAQFLEAQGMIREVRSSNWIAAIVFAASLVFLIPTYGLIGAAVARIMFRFVYTGATWWYVMRAPIKTA